MDRCQLLAISPQLWVMMNIYIHIYVCVYVGSLGSGESVMTEAGK